MWISPFQRENQRLPPKSCSMFWWQGSATVLGSSSALVNRAEDYTTKVNYINLPRVSVVIISYYDCKSAGPTCHLKEPPHEVRPLERLILMFQLSLAS